MKLKDILVETILLEMPEEDAIELDRVLTHFFKSNFGWDFDSGTHFKNRVVPRGSGIRREYDSNQSDREKNTTKEEVYDTIFKLFSNKKYRGIILGARQHGREFMATVTNKSNNVNIAFKVAYQNKNRPPLFKIIMILRAKNFVSRRLDQRSFYV